MNKNNLIFDIGMHIGEDTGYYLHLGYNVVAVDADPGMIENAKEKFHAYVGNGSLQLLNYAAFSKDNEYVELNVSEWSLWNSLRKEVAERETKSKSSVKVPTTRLDTLMKKYGEPYYCKIDVEGYDAIAAETLLNSEFRPEYISVETECVGATEKINDEKALETLEALYRLGYTKFKLVDQATLTVLEPNRLFYGMNISPINLFKRIKLKLGLENISYLDPKGEIPRIKKAFNYEFAKHSSGPFGKDLKGKWVNYSTAKKMLLYHRNTFFKQNWVNNYSFWCDWHATK